VVHRRTSRRRGYRVSHLGAWSQQSSASKSDVQDSRARELSQWPCLRRRAASPPLPSDRPTSADSSRGGATVRPRACKVLVHVTYTRFFAARAEWARGPHSVGAVRRNSTAGPIRILTVAVLQPAIGAHSRISTQERPQVRPTPTPLHHRHAFFAPFFTDRLPRDHAHPSIVSPKSARRSVPMPCYRSMV
jgi:hypothetical protein